MESYPEDVAGRPVSASFLHNATVSLFERAGFGGGAGGRVGQLPARPPSVRPHGESGALALAYPVTVDEVIYCASMVLQNAARQGIKPHWLAYVALGLGIAATLAANVAAGLSFGPVGALLASWPAPALVISYELLMIILRTSARAAATAPAADTRTRAARQPERSRPAVAERYADELFRGEVPGVRRIRRDLKVGQPRAQEVREYRTALARA